MSKPIMWTSDDIKLFVVCRFVYKWSYNDIGKVLRCPTSMVTTLALRCGVFSPGEVLNGRKFRKWEREGKPFYGRARRNKFTRRGSRNGATLGV